MNIAIQATCQSEKSAKNDNEGGGVRDFANQELVQFAKRPLGTFTAPGASNPPTRS
jgi:hypothetical protein